tara:strand:- start:20321 stop:20785 length:465 start_codon:yes stop_codon:yes gene_type:complete
MQQSFKRLFPEMPDESRVWTYLCNRSLNDQEANLIENQIKTFTGSWKAHQKPLCANGQLLFNQYIVLVVDESIERISGCSIDSSVHFVKMIENHLEVDFFNRLNVLVLKNETPKLVSYHDIGSYKGDFVFNPRIESLHELRENWLVEIKDAPYF